MSILLPDMLRMQVLSGTLTYPATPEVSFPGQIDLHFLPVDGFGASLGQVSTEQGSTTYLNALRCLDNQRYS
jgi:hypothetical protein